jgi:uncharacterized protein (DUF2336 family)
MMKGFLKRLVGARELPEKLSYEDARAVLESQERAAQQELAGRADAEPEMLYYLAANGDATTRGAVAANAATPAKADRILADDVDPVVRGELARKIGRLLPDLLASERERVCELTLETLQKLANDQIPRVRAILAEEVAKLDRVPRDIVLKLAHDAEATVCVPILEYSPLLSDADLLEVIATARAQDALAAIARRRGVSEGVSDAIVASLDIPAVAALLANPNARVRAEALDKIIDHAETIEEWHGPLAMRTDLSLRALRRIAGFVGAAVLEQLCERHGLDDETQAYLNRCLRQRLERDDERSHTAADSLRAQILKTYEDGALTEDYVEKAVLGGQRDVTLECLAALTPASRQTIDKIFASRNGKAITALCWQAGLSMRVAFKVQTLIAKLHADEILPARAGVAYPLTEAEMQWHLSYFGLVKNGS